MFIDSDASRHAAHAAFDSLRATALSRPKLEAFLGCLAAAPKWQWAAVELSGLALIEGGTDLADATVIERGLETLRDAFGDSSPHSAYNIANGENALWELALRNERVASALVSSRRHLHAARRLYERVGTDDSVDDALRAQCLVNAANSYDNLGRDQEALGLWDSALALQPNFAMARGNRAIALLQSVPFAGEHAGMLVVEAGHDLDRALAATEDILRVGGHAALAQFQERRAGLPADLPPMPAEDAQWADPHLAWCRSRELFLHTSHRCLTEKSPHFDPLFFASLSGPAGSEQHGDDLTDSVNALKQEYVSVRYLTWLALDPNSHIAAEAAAVKARVRFVDAFTGARWGVRTGLAIQAFVSTTNLLDKVAVVTHAYFETGRNPKKVTFRSLWKQVRGKVETMEPKFEAAFDLGWNPGLAALCDLSNDLEDDTPLSRLVAMRHAATHRLLVAHDFTAPSSGDWITRVEFDELAERSIEQLRLARASLLYLLRAIDAHERHLDRLRGSQFYVPVPTLEVDPDLSELD